MPSLSHDGIRQLLPYQQLYQGVLSAADIKPFDRVIDIGAGTGE